MIKPQLFYIGTSKVKEIRGSGSVTFDWGTQTGWTTYASVPAQAPKKIKKKKASNGTYNERFKGNGTNTYFNGTFIPRQAEREIEGVSRPCDVRWWSRSYVKYQTSKALNKEKKMKRWIYPDYQYKLQYKDKPIYTAEYSTYKDGMDYIFFSDVYFENGEAIPTNGHIPHPVVFESSYFDVRRNFESNANNSDGRDNSGTFVLENVRSNLMQLSLEWEGLSDEKGADLLDTLNPKIENGEKKNYLIVQFWDPIARKAINKTFVASERSYTPNPRGGFKKIAVMLTEV